MEFNLINDYQVMFYPTNELYYSFVTETPRNNCMVVVFLIAFTALLVLFYSHLVKKRELMLLEVAKYSFANSAARDAVLLAKKVYVRYISHEMRTPLNAAYLGLKILEKEILKIKNSDYMERLSTVKDIVDACDIAVGILNDLLNYDKLEDGALCIEPKKMLVLPFLISSVNLFLLPAKEKGIEVIFDISDKDGNSDYCDNNNNDNNDKSNDDNSISAASYLSEFDCIDGDQHKLSQVIRNLISNAIKVRK